MCACNLGFLACVPSAHARPLLTQQYVLRIQLYPMVQVLTSSIKHTCKFLWAYGYTPDAYLQHWLVKG